MDQRMWTVPALANFLGKPASWVYDNHEKQAIPSFRVGQQLRFWPSEIMTWLEENCREQGVA
ncbi:helix-turn-helix domain-containing protein [Streptomyces sp. NPDC015125]|uniref:helix-turn-helix domain-containing protein n=1 Tax=Streptomyces sp. NPDC015125 TaxID=3364938 RepID=UPI0036FBE4E9